MESAPPVPSGANFIRTLVEADLASGACGAVVTRFPPEPNGYLHIGHAKAICLNFGLARDFGGTCNLRMDDTNPSTEDEEYVAAIRDDVRWLGFETGRVLYASDYYEALYRWAEELVEKGLAYVCPLTEEEIRVWRGTVNEPGRDSPGRQNTVAQNLDLLRRMRAGAFADGAMTLRARIDMGSANMKLRDPLLYRIRHAHHYRTGDRWCIYPMYDFAHPLSDALEGITHSICTLEFENNRDIYDWLIANCSVSAHPKQIEFARLNLTYTVMSKRKLLELVQTGAVRGWDDPRMPTLAGLRRRGVTPSALRDFAERIGVAKANSTVEIALFETCLRDDLNPIAPRVMAVLRPLKVIVESWPAGQVEWLDAPYFPHDVPREGSRKIPFSRELVIERDDFAEDPPKGYNRLAPGREVRLRYGYILRCVGVERDAAGEIALVRCTHDPQSRGGNPADGRAIKGTIQWLSAAHALPALVRLVEPLFSVKNPGVGAEGADWKREINPDSLTAISDALIEPSVAADAADTRYQFERIGYFWRDPVDATAERLVFNRIVALRDSWGRAQKGELVPPVSPLPEPVAPKVRPKAAPQVSAEQAAAALALQDGHGLGADEARVLAGEPALLALFTEALASCPDARALASWTVNEVQGELRGRDPAGLSLHGAALGALVALLQRRALSAAAAKEVLAELVANGGDPAEIVASRGLGLVSDPAAIQPVVARIIAAYPAQAAQVRAGKTSLLGFFVGQVRKEIGGRADPQVVGELVRAAFAL